jgi:hypothetical protein
MSVERMLDLMTTLTLPEAVDVDLALHRYIALLESWARPAPDVIDQVSTAGGCYRRELVKCGKAKCKCASGELHGPYWYHYSYKPGGGQRKRYIGKELPAGVSLSSA